MQVSKSYTGTLSPVGSTGSRQSSYGVTTTITTYPAKADFINQTIADFLHDECGVDAAYEARGNSAAKFLWIYGVPFLLAMPSASANYFSFYGPMNATALIAGSSTASSASHSALFSAANAGAYSFTLYFTGDPASGFALRIKGYGRTAISNGYTLRFIPAENVSSGASAVLWAYGDPSISGGMFGNVNGIDLNEDGGLNEASFSIDLTTYRPNLQSKEANKTSNPRKFPLIPIMIGIWRLKRCFYYLTGYSLTAAALATVENQTEIEIAGRRLIVTTPETPASGYINLGLMEVNS